MALPVIQLIVGTTRRDRFSEKPLEWLVDRLARRDDLEFEVLDLRDHPLPLYDLAVAPACGGRNYENDAVRAPRCGSRSGRRLHRRHR